MATWGAQGTELHASVSLLVKPEAGACLSLSAAWCLHGGCGHESEPQAKDTGERDRETETEKERKTERRRERERERKTEGERKRQGNRERERERERETESCCFLEEAAQVVKMLNGQADSNVPLVSFMPFTGTLRHEVFPETIKKIIYQPDWSPP